MHAATIALAQFLLAPVSIAQSELLVNPSFEGTSLEGCATNLANEVLTSSMTGVTAYGPGDEVDVLRDVVGCFGPAFDGDVKLGLAAQTSGEGDDELTIATVAALEPGKTYSVSLHVLGNTEFFPESGGLAVGISQGANEFGRYLFPAHARPGVWVQRVHTFQPQTAVTHLSLRARNDGAWTHVDGLSLVEVSVAEMASDGTTLGIVPAVLSPGGRGVVEADFGARAGGAVALIEVGGQPGETILLDGRGRGSFEVTAPVAIRAEGGLTVRVYAYLDGGAMLSTGEGTLSVRL